MQKSLTQSEQVGEPRLSKGGDKHEAIASRVCRINHKKKVNVSPTKCKDELKTKVNKQATCNKTFSYQK